MSRKNFKVATAENGMTPTQDKKHLFVVAKSNAPTGKVVTLKDKEKIRKEREEQYKNFRINALKRRAKRIGLTEEQTEVKVKELINQIETPNSYTVLVFFSPKDGGLVKAALQKEDLAWKMMSTSHFYIDADQETLKTLREIMPPSAKIHPYVKKKPPVLPVPEPVKAKAKPHTKAEKKASAMAAKKARKAAKIAAHLSRKEHSKQRKAEMNKKKRAQQKALKLFQKRLNKRKATTVQLKSKKGSESLKTASTNLKKAA